MNVDELNALLGSLRAIRRDAGWIEAKRATAALPRDALTTLSAFANAEGGTLLLGVSGRDDFSVTGVDDTSAVLEQVQQACAELEPVLRPMIEVVHHPDGIVIAVDVPAVPRTRRPCFLRSRGALDGSYVRVGDADERLTEPEVLEMLAAREGHDHSARPAPDGAELDRAAVAAFVGAIRDAGATYRAARDAEILEAWSAVGADGRPTLAGLLALGRTPARHVAAARIAYRVLPSAGSPSGARFAATHLEGTIGELIEAGMARLRRDLRTHQVSLPTGEVVDRLDVPELALREVLANALIHRSLTDDQATASVVIEVADEAVRVISPGGLHVTADVATLGLVPLSGVRNLALVRICEFVRTPRGARVLENQASGIRAADIAAHEQGAAPPVFIDLPAAFEVTLLRGPLPAVAGPGGAGSLDRADVRLLAWASRVAALGDELDARHLPALALDSRLGARLLAPSRPEMAAARLAVLERTGLLRSRPRPGRIAWELAAVPDAAASAGAATGVSVRASGGAGPGGGPGGAPRDRVHETVVALAALDGEASRAALMTALGLRSNRSASLRLNEAIAAGAVDPSTSNPYDPGRTYRLTTLGRALAGGLTPWR